MGDEYIAWDDEYTAWDDEYIADPFAPLFARLAEVSSPANRPHITLSYAQSLDGSIAGGAGGTLGLSSPASQAITHRLRAAHDGILVGIGTVLADNPRLTVRLDAVGRGPLDKDLPLSEAKGRRPALLNASPQPVVLDSRLRFPLTAALLDHPRPPWIATDEAIVESSRARALSGRGARLLPLPVETHPMDAPGYLCLPRLLAELATSGMRRLMVEGGAQVISSFVREGLVDLLVVTITPHLVGGLHSLHLPGASLERLPRLQAVHWRPAGPDWIVWGVLT